MTAGGGVDVLAVLERANERLIDSGVPYGALVTATAAIAELLAADREYDEAWAALGESSATQEAFHVARIRYRTAIARRASALAALEQQA